MVDAVEPKATWKSKLLGDLGVKSAAIVEHGPKGGNCGLALKTALAIALGCASPDASASTNATVDDIAVSRISAQYGADTALRSEQARRDAADQAKAQAEDPSVNSSSTVEIAASVGSVLLNPKAAILKQSSRFVVDQAVGAVSDSDDVGEQVGKIAGAVVGVATMSPVIGAYLVYDQAKGTYAFVQEHQQKKLDEKLSQVAARVERVQAEEVMRIRLAERSARQALPESVAAADRAELAKMVDFYKETGYIDPALQARIDVEQAVDKAGYPTEAWYPSYVQAVSPAQNNDAPKDIPTTKDRFFAGLKNLTASADAKQAMRNSEENSLKMPGMR